MCLPLLKKRRVWVTLSIIVSALTVLLLFSGLFQWSPLNCWHEEVDINTGRIRHTRYLLFCRIGDRMEDTWLSRLANKPNNTPDWRRVNTYSPGLHHSPHYQYHGAIHQIKVLEQADAVVPFDPSARRKVADTLLTLWQTTGSYLDDDEFVERVSQIAFELHENGSSVFSFSDVPAH